jgi:predicted small lipoprotein YifL
MKAILHTTAAILAIASLAGCAAPKGPLNADEVPLGSALTSQADEKAEITGSRLPTRRTEKMVSQIGGKDYKDNKSALAAPLEVH